MNACPVFREIGGHAYNSIYPGPIGSVISAGLFGSEFVPLAQASSLCGACKDACPVDIDLPKLLTRVRAGYSTQPTYGDGKGLSPSTRFGLQLYTRLVTHPRLYAASQKFAALGSFLFAPFSQWIRPPAFTGWGYSKDFPRFAGKTFRERFIEPDGKLSVIKVENKIKENINSKNLQEHPQGTRAPALQRVEQFTNELTALSGNVYQTKHVTKGVIEFLKTCGVTKIHLEPNTLNENLLREANIDFTHEPDPQIIVGVTNAICGLADTGSVLIADGDGSPLQGSLLPEVHIAVLKSSNILPSLPDAMKLPQVKESNAAAFITGPSRTADIEMTLTIGVHGPKEIHVFVDDSNSE